MKPLVSCIVLSYNHEKFIKQALDGLFSQDYENIEYIISDDNSPDNSFEIIKNYLENIDIKNKKIVLNQNNPNLGLIKHLNKILKKANGQYIVLMAGDDISFSNRVSTLVDIFENQHVSMILSNATRIDQDGTVLGPLHLLKMPKTKTIEDIIKVGVVNIAGATMACHRDVFFKFGDIPENLDNEDDNLPIKATMLNGIFVLDRSLLYYRIHSGSLSSTLWTKKTFKEHITADVIRNKSLIKHWNAWINLFETYGINECHIPHLKEKIAYKQIVNQLYDSSLLERISLFKMKYGYKAIFVTIYPRSILVFQLFKQKIRDKVKFFLILIRDTNGQ